MAVTVLFVAIRLFDDDLTTNPQPVISGALSGDETWKESTGASIPPAESATSATTEGLVNDHAERTGMEACLRTTFER